MRALLALIYRDFSIVPRKKYFRWKRVGFIVMILSIVYLNTQSYYYYMNPSQVGLRIFSMFSSILFMAVIAISPTTAASLISEEREKKTLGLLLISDLSNFDIIVGKLLSQFLFVLLTFLSCLPLFMICISLGGISGEQIVAVFAVILSFIIVGAAIGIFSSVIANTTGARGLAVLFTILYLSFFPILYGIYAAITWKQSRMLGNLISIFSPVAAMTYALRGTNIIYSFYNSIVNVAWSIVLLIISAKLLPRSYENMQKPPLKVRIKRYFAARKEKKKRKPRTTIKGNPVAWHDYNKFYGGKTSATIKYIVLGILWFFLFLLIATANRGRSNTFPIICAFLFFLSYACGAIFMFSYSTQSFAKEKERKTLELIVISGLTELEIVFGKWKAIMKAALPFFIFGSISGIGFLLTEGADDIEPVVFIYSGYAVAYLWAVCTLSMFLSFKTGNTRKASSYVIIILIIWHIVSNFIFALFMVVARGGSFFHGLHFIWGIFYFFMGLFFFNRTVNALKNLTT